MRRRSQDTAARSRRVAVAIARGRRLTWVVASSRLRCCPLSCSRPRDGLPVTSGDGRVGAPGSTPTGSARPSGPGWSCSTNVRTRRTCGGSGRPARLACADSRPPPGGPTLQHAGADACRCLPSAPGRRWLPVPAASARPGPRKGAIDLWRPRLRADPLSQASAVIVSSAFPAATPATPSCSGKQSWMRMASARAVGRGGTP